MTWRNPLSLINVSEKSSSQETIQLRKAKKNDNLFVIWLNNTLVEEGPLHVESYQRVKNILTNGYNVFLPCMSGESYVWINTETLQRNTTVCLPMFNVMDQKTRSVIVSMMTSTPSAAAKKDSTLIALTCVIDQVSIFLSAQLISPVFPSLFTSPGWQFCSYDCGLIYEKFWVKTLWYIIQLSVETGRSRFIKLRPQNALLQINNHIIAPWRHH